jgi:hypothetical protein
MDAQSALWPALLPCCTTLYKRKINLKRERKKGREGKGKERKRSRDKTVPNIKKNSFTRDQIG